MWYRVTGCIGRGRIDNRNLNLEVTFKQHMCDEMDVAIIKCSGRILWKDKALCENNYQITKSIDCLTKRKGRKTNAAWFLLYEASKTAQHIDTENSLYTEQSGIWGLRCGGCGNKPAWGKECKEFTVVQVWLKPPFDPQLELWTRLLDVQVCRKLEPDVDVAPSAHMSYLKTLP